MLIICATSTAIRKYCDFTSDDHIEGQRLFELLKAVDLVCWPRLLATDEGGLWGVARWRKILGFALLVGGKKESIKLQVLRLGNKAIRWSTTTARI